MIFERTGLHPWRMLAPRPLIQRQLVSMKSTIDRKRGKTKREKGKSSKEKQQEKGRQCYMTFHIRCTTRMGWNTEGRHTSNALNVDAVAAKNWNIFVDMWAGRPSVPMQLNNEAKN